MLTVVLNLLRSLFRLYATKVPPFSTQANWYNPYCTCYVLSRANRWKRMCQKGMKNENDVKIKIKLQGIIWVNSSCIFENQLQQALCLWHWFYFFFAQMSHRISAKWKIPAWGLFLYRLINHFPSLLPSFPKLNDITLFSKCVIYYTLNGNSFRKENELKIWT